jgi:hypothetical protein
MGRKTKCDGPSMSNNICSNCVQSHKTCTYVSVLGLSGKGQTRLLTHRVTIGKIRDREGLRRRQFIFHIIKTCQSHIHTNRYITSLEDKVEKMEALLRMVSLCSPAYMRHALCSSQQSTWLLWYGLRHFAHGCLAGLPVLRDTVVRITIGQNICSKLLPVQLGPEVDLDVELGPPIVRDSWKTDRSQAPTAPASSKATILPTEPMFQHGTHLSPHPPNAMPSARVPITRYLHQKDRSRSSSHSASSSVVIVTTPNASPDHQRSPSSGSLDSWTASDESDDDSTPFSSDGKRLTMGPMDSKNLSMESPLMFVGKSSTYGLSCKVRKIRAGYMDEATRAGIDRDTAGGNGDHTPKYIHPHRRPEYWTTPTVSISNYLHVFV